ncbi:MAG: methyltransferase domain-containing protein [Roseiarcus sp.]
MGGAVDRQEWRQPEVGRCRCCAAALDGGALDLGALPVCNRFSAERRELPRQPLVLAACRTCGLIQLRAPPAVASVTPEAAWIRYTEPHAHLDDLVESVLALLKDAGRAPAAGLALGLGPFEAPLLDRLALQGMRTEAPDLATAEDGASLAGGFPYLETWQARLESGRLGRLAQKVGRADIVSCRYLLEHCHDPIASLQALGALLSPDGVLLLEIPDSAKFLAAADYAFPWEEHVCYFVEASFREMVERAGYQVVALKRYSGLLEDALVIVARRSQAFGPRRETIQSGRPDPLFASYRAAYPATRAFMQQRLAELSGPSRDRVALFGLGHQAIMFVNALGLADFIGATVDDDPDKLGLLPPGLATRVTSSIELCESPTVRTCLLAINPASEPKVRARLAPLAARGVGLHSIYAGAEGSILTGRPR